MKPEEAFGVAVRTVGLLMATSWLLAIFVLVLVNRAEFLVITIPSGLVGLYLLRGAPGVIEFAYPPKSTEEPPS